MKETIRKILREEFEYKQQLFNLLKTGDSDNLEMVRMISQGQGINILELLIEFFKENLEPPYFKFLNHFDLSDGELNYVLSGIFGESVTINKMSYGFIIYDDNHNEIYYEKPNGHWYKKEYDKNQIKTFLKSELIN